MPRILLALILFSLVACSFDAPPVQSSVGGAVRATATPSVHELHLNSGERFMILCDDDSEIVFGSNGENGIIGGCGLE